MGATFSLSCILIEAMEDFLYERKLDKVKSDFFFLSLSPEEKDSRQNVAHKF